jgi:hypothetical protein
LIFKEYSYFLSLNSNPGSARFGETTCTPWGDKFTVSA